PALQRKENNVMRVYIRVPAARALQAIERGFEDWHTDMGNSGVWCENYPRGTGRAASGQGILFGGPEGDTVLCADVPEEVFSELECQESTRPLKREEWERMDNGGAEPDDLEYQRMGWAIIPAAVLNSHGKPQIYDHEFSRYLISASDAHPTRTRSQSPA